MSNIYSQLGVETIVNAKGPATRVGGGTLPIEVADAMRDATQHCVDIAQLQGRASEIIAGVTGAQAGYVTSGAAAGLLLGTAACVTGLDPAKMNRLPATRGMRNEVVMVRSQRNFYDHAVRTVGIDLVEVGIADRYSGAGVRDAEAWEIADAITERTACVFYVAAPQSQPALREVIDVAHRAGVPVLVDAAAQLPPAANLERFVSEGADLVAFSGGKAIRGPQGTGILCGRKDLVAAAALQNLDQDVLIEQWRPPPALFGGLDLQHLPHHGIGRPCKVGKEQIVGLLLALQRFAAQDHEQQFRLWRRWLEALAAAVGSHPGARVTIVDDEGGVTPQLELALNEDVAHIKALDLVVDLQMGTPGIQADPSRAREGVVIFNPSCLQEAQIPVVAARLNGLLRAGTR
ncbi:MAG: aminotransferase class V-fold PLP-dependent enzyme [Gammaproteobacteria bacterium]